MIGDREDREGPGKSLARDPPGLGGEEGGLRRVLAGALDDLLEAFARELGRLALDASRGLLPRWESVSNMRPRDEMRSSRM